MNAFGVITQGQNSTEDNAIVDSTHGISKRLPRTRKLPAKFKDTLTSDRQILKTAGKKATGKRNIVITDDEDEVEPRKKKKPKTRTPGFPAGDNPGSRLKTHVFSRASEDAQDTHANTEGSSNLDDSGNRSAGETNATDARGQASDEEWEFSQLDDMAVKDAKVRDTHQP